MKSLHLLKMTASQKLNKFITELENMMVKDSDDSSARLVPTDEAIINEVFIDGFHVLYKVQIGELQTQALFDTGTSINAISFKFYNTMQQ